MKRTAKRWVITFVCLQLAVLVAITGLVVYIDPFFHYHAPFLSQFFYALDDADQRSQNEGILKHFDYNAIITGSSMTANFKTSQMDELFGVKSIKVPFFGASFKEVSDALSRTLSYNPDVQIVVRSLDLPYFLLDPHELRTDLGTYPTYFYNNNPFDDVNYLFNRSVMLKEILPMLGYSLAGGEPGITDFDSYSNRMEYHTFGPKTVLGTRGTYLPPTEINKLTDEQRTMIKENVSLHLTSLAEQYPDITFYYFFTPYSAAWWGSTYQSGNLEQEIELEKIAIEEMLNYDNIRLFSFSTFFDITTDLNNYLDTTHYADWINEDLLRFMKEGTGLLTEENYQAYLEQEYEFYKTFDYNSLFDQVDDPNY